MPMVCMEISGQLDGNVTARDKGLVGCRRCARVWPIAQSHCGRCGGRLQSRDERSLQKVWAWWLAGAMAYIPANIYPMLETRTLVQEDISFELPKSVRSLTVLGAG